MSKGQGLSITTIIIALIVLVVLVVLVMIFTGYFNRFGDDVEGQSVRECTKIEGAYEKLGFSCGDDALVAAKTRGGHVCCVGSAGGSGGTDNDDRPDEESSTGYACTSPTADPICSLTRLTSEGYTCATCFFGCEMRGRDPICRRE